MDKPRKLGSLVPYQKGVVKIKKPKAASALERKERRIVTTSQLVILLYHFYIGIQDPEIYYLDDEESAEKLQERINQEIEIDQDALEKLLYYTTIAYENKTFWHPEKQEYPKFVRSFLNADEKYDQLLNLIVDKKNKKGRLI